MHPMFAPLIMGSIFLVTGAVSFWGRSKLSRMGAKLSAAVNENTTYDRAYRRRLRYGYISGLLFLIVGAAILVFGVVRLVISAT